MPACEKYSVSVSNSGAPAMTAGSMKTTYAAGNTRSCRHFIFFASSRMKNTGITKTACNLNARQAASDIIAPVPLPLMPRYRA